MRKILTSIGWLVLWVTSPSLLPAQTVTGDGLTVAWDDHGAALTFADGEGRVFARLRPSGTPGRAREAEWAHPRLGSGPALEVELEGGDRIVAAPAPGRPFVLVRGILANRGREPRLVSRHDVGAVAIDAGVPAAGLKALGTAGLTAPDGHPGSYAFLRSRSPGLAAESSRAG